MSLFNTEEIHPAVLGKALIFGFIFLLSAHLFHHYILSATGFRVELIDLNDEQNLPTLYSAVLWFIAAFFAFGLKKKL